MNVEIVEFPETRVAAIEYKGPPETEHLSVMKLIQWRKENNFPPSPAYRNYGLHYNDPRKVPPQEYRVDLCISVDRKIGENPYGVINKVIPACRCARARHLGSRKKVLAAEFLYEQWLPQSGEQHSGLPIIFHYVNVGPDIREQDMITDVYLPLK
ncbi:AraC family transcriptional regulator [Microbulbifer pacificus]|uniref:GyrI-like domain-containing protein n=1 Tax=Microbulbifer pacificus TaxID=407164 RepID=A0AAU0N481_9GAMM|nr:GyrI-like domain-containing protein [Microbulbifer pacificus]WOX06856.1 GyrI-like domain-containing protein [Microbulbifer pacificus]